MSNQDFLDAMSKYDSVEYVGVKLLIDDFRRLLALAKEPREDLYAAQIQLKLNATRKWLDDIRQTLELPGNDDSVLPGDVKIMMMELHVCKEAHKSVRNTVVMPQSAIQQALGLLVEHEPLSAELLERITSELLDGKCQPSQIGALLTGLLIR